MKKNYIYLKGNHQHLMQSPLQICTKKNQVIYNGENSAQLINGCMQFPNGGAAVNRKILHNTT